MPVINKYRYGRGRVATGPYVKGLSEMQKKQVVKIAKNATKAGMEKKRLVYINSVSVLACSAYTANPLIQIAQGATSGNRISNAINLDYITIRFRFSTSPTNNKEVVMWFYCFWSDEELFNSGTPTQTTSTNINTTLPFIGTSSVNYAATNIIDTMQAHVVRDRRLVIPVNVSGLAGEHMQTIKINFKGKKIKYLGDSNSYNDGKNLYWGFVADAQGATADTTVVGTFLSTQEVHFRE